MGPRHIPTVGTLGGAVSYERGTPVPLPYSGSPTLHKLRGMRYKCQLVNSGNVNRQPWSEKEPGITHWRAQTDRDTARHPDTGVPRSKQNAPP